MIVVILQWYLILMVFFQNISSPHGDGVYMKSVAHEGPDFVINERLLAKISELQLKDMTYTVIFEYIPLNKSKTVPNGTMAFHRSGKATVLAMLKWDNAIRDRSQEAQGIGREICGSIVGDKSRLNDPSSFGYGNYGESFDRLFLHRF